MAATRAIGKFQILGTLGQGAHSTILHVRCQSDGRQYALKVVPIDGKDDQKFYEQARHGTVNERTDIYNFGATMYRLTTWRLPPSTVPARGSPTLSSKMFETLLKPVEQYSASAPRELCKLIHRCLAFHPEKRPER